MKCDNCGMVFNGNNDTCPLCGYNVGIQNPAQRFLLNEFKLKGNVRLSILQLNFYVLVNLSLVLLATNLIVDYSFVWSLIPILIFATFNYILKIICYPYKLTKFISRYFLLLCTCLIAMQYLTFKGQWAFNYVVPSLNILMSLFIFLNIFTRTSLWSIVKMLICNLIVTITLLTLLLVGITSSDIVTKSIIIVSCTLCCLVVFNSAYCFFKFYRR